MLKEIHFLLTYACNYECDHCFLYCRPGSGETFTLAQIRAVLAQGREIESLSGVYFEGGEPLLFYPLLAESIRASHNQGLSVGMVTNAYMSTSVEDAELWLKPLAEVGLGYLAASDDTFHGEGEDTPGKRTLIAAERLGLDCGAICIEPPSVVTPGAGQDKGDPVVGGGAMFKGRAADKLTEGLPRRSWRGFTECPHEELVSPNRVHLDSLGNVMPCQGISLGNVWERPLAELIADYRPEDHPILGPLAAGGPAELIREHELEVEPEYVDECHACYCTRKELLDRFPEYLGPRQVYGK